MAYSYSVKNLKQVNKYIYSNTGILLSQVVHLNNIKHAWNNYHGKHAFILRTIPRSGSHYFMNILANYIGFQFFNEKNSLDLLDIKEKFWSGLNPCHNYYDSEKMFRLTGFKNFIFVHVSHDHRFKHFNYYKKNVRGLVNLYRNPLDAIVSSYFRVLNHRNISTMNKKKRKNFINMKVEDYIKQYTSINEMREKKNVINISYENLYLNPLDIMNEVLNFFKIPLSEKNLNKSIQQSNINYIKEKEKNFNNRSFYNSKVSSHIHSGKINQWKKFFSSDEIKRIETQFNKSGISFNEFIFE